MTDNKQYLFSGLYSGNKNITLQAYAACIVSRAIVSGHVRFQIQRDMDDLFPLIADYLVWTKNDAKVFKALLPKEFETSTTENYELNKKDKLNILELTAFSDSVCDTIGVIATMERMANRHKNIFLNLLKRTATFIEQWLKDKTIDFPPFIELIKDFLGLSTEEGKFLELVYLKSNNSAFSTVLDRLNVVNRDEGISSLSYMLDIAPAIMRTILSRQGRLMSLQLIDMRCNAGNIGEMVQSEDLLSKCFVLQISTVTDLEDFFIKKLPTSSLSKEDFDHIRSDYEMIYKLIKGTQAINAIGVNILFYGYPGTGKTELAKCIAKELNLNAYQVKSEDDERNPLRSSERISAIRISQDHLKGQRNALLVCDEIEDIFGHETPDFFRNLFGQRAYQNSCSKAWMTEMLETNTTPMIWISNSIDQIDPAYLRRFQYHVRFSIPPRAARQRILQRRFKALPISEMLFHQLVEDPELTPAALESAAKLAEIISIKNNNDFDQVVRQYLNNYKTATCAPLLPAEQIKRQEYDLNFLNIKSFAPIEKILTAITRRGQGSLLLHGAPGTGKTCFAEFIAERMHTQLTRKTAANIMNKYVGDTEKYIAEMFRESASQRSVLLLDEADSILRSRSGARQSWEVTQVNELLQQMERFRGVFICATNLFGDIDHAALRRFTFKIEFMPLTQEQREALFIREALNGDGSNLKQLQSKELLAMDTLTPGDFDVVKRQLDIFNEHITPDDFLGRLKAEIMLKDKHSSSKNIGFSLK